MNLPPFACHSNGRTIGRRRPAGARALRRLAAAGLGMAAAVSVMSACGESSGSAADGASTTTSTPWSVDVAEVDTPTMSELATLLGHAPASGDERLKAAWLPADVFANGDNRPDTTRPEWTGLIAALCTGDAPLLPIAEANGWAMAITGYVDQEGPQGPGTLNDHLDDDRAEAAAHQVAADCDIDPASIAAIGGGIHPDDVREVVVSFIPATDSQEDVQ